MSSQIAVFRAKLLVGVGEIEILWRNSLGCCQVTKKNTLRLYLPHKSAIRNHIEN
jgi:hypothetical protein